MVVLCWQTSHKLAWSESRDLILNFGPIMSSERMKPGIQVGYTDWLQWVPTLCMIDCSRMGVFRRSCDLFDFFVSKWYLENDAIYRDNGRLICGLWNGTNINDLKCLEGHVKLLFETFLTRIPREMQHILTTICLHMNRRANIQRAISISTLVMKLKDFSRGHKQWRTL